MEVTQWVILGLAISAVLGVYLYTRRNDGPNPWRDMGDPDDELLAQDGESTEPDILVDPSVADEWSGFTPAQGQDPALDVEPAVDTISPAQLKDTPATVVEEAPAAPTQQPEAEAEAAVAQGSETPVEQKIVVLHVVGREQAQFAGDDIHRALQASQLLYGMRDIYHRVAEVNGRPESVFSIANMLKPGNLDPEQAADLQTPGLVMFMVLPGPVDGNKAFHDMLQTAQDVANELGGVVLDDKRLPLTRQAAQYLIDEIAQLERRRRLADA